MRTMKAFADGTKSRRKNWPGYGVERKSAAGTKQNVSDVRRKTSGVDKLPTLTIGPTDSVRLKSRSKNLLCHHWLS